MNRPTDHDSAFEAELAALVPVAPSAGLRRDVEMALAAPAAKGRWLGERLAWACGGAVAGALAASLALAAASRLPVGTPPAVAPAATAGGQREAGVDVAESPIEVAEEAVAWADAGVQFIDDRTPARILRRVVVERHRPVGGAEYRVPREDVIVLPVALR